MSQTPSSSFERKRNDLPVTNMGPILILILSFLCLLAGCGPTDDKHINFIGTAQQGNWFNDIPETLSFPGADNDSKGFARFADAQLEDGVRYDLLLETHPRWAQQGAVDGHFRLTIPQDCSFRAVVGFIEGATATDGVTFQVLWKRDNQPAGNPPITAVQGEFLKKYDHSLGTFTIDLRALAGQSGEFILKVKAGESSGQDWAVWQTALIAPFAENADIDKDGVGDEDELQLLQRFSPYYKYSAESINNNTVQEEYRPTDAIWYVRHSDLVYGGDQNSHVMFTRDQLNLNAGLIANAQMNGEDYSNILASSKKTSFRLNIYDDYRSGFHNRDGHDWPEILTKGNIGLYGHVVPTADRNLLKIEYWQFFGFNQANAYGTEAYDHEGDWTTVQLIYNVSEDKLTSVSYAHHGNITTLELGNEKQHVFEFIQGRDIVVFKQDDFAPVNNFVEFFRDRFSHATSIWALYTHPVVYIEWGGHEFWPRPSGSQFGSPNHDGKGDFSYLTHDVPNLGEVENPINASFGVIMQYNGRWGAWNSSNENPPGVELHSEWQWPVGSGIRAKIPNGDLEN